MILATITAGFALLLIQQAAHEWMRFTASFTDFDRAESIFPHPNTLPKTYQKRKP